MTTEIAIETILEQYRIGGMEGLPTASIISSHLYLGESEMKHQADMRPREQRRIS